MNKLLEIIKLIQEMIPKYNYPDNEKIVTLIDPGHGGVVNGLYVTAPSKMVIFPEFTFYEGVFNRALAWTYALRLYERNFGYHMIVTDDEDVPLLTRVCRANDTMRYLDIRKKKCYLHSIHANAATKPEASGIEVYSSYGNTTSDLIASMFYKHLESIGWKMRPDFQDQDPDKEASFYILNHTKMPAILTETGFYTNKAQADMMRSQLTINTIADYFLIAHFEIVAAGIRGEKKFFL